VSSSACGLIILSSFFVAVENSFVEGASKVRRTRAIAWVSGARGGRRERRPSCAQVVVAKSGAIMMRHGAPLMALGQRPRPILADFQKLTSLCHGLHHQSN